MASGCSWVLELTVSEEEKEQLYERVALLEERLAAESQRSACGESYENMVLEKDKCIEKLQAEVKASQEKLTAHKWATRKRGVKTETGNMEGTLELKLEMFLNFGFYSHVSATCERSACGSQKGAMDPEGGDGSPGAGAVLSHPTSHAIVTCHVENSYSFGILQIIKILIYRKLKHKKTVKNLQTDLAIAKQEAAITVLELNEKIKTLCDRKPFPR
ncbi:hypothetical protein STEG23_008998, partial [Scotinomys teguina]